ncbi:MAG: recombinase, partial [Ignavibacteria bacterium]|nr:recombinase [Ignavibacteria bacterium]
ATTLTGKNYSSVLAISTDALTNLRGNYNELEPWWIDFFGYGFDGLTESEARYILNSKKDADSIRNRIIAERQKGFF